jgi:hypothetical protein
MYKESFKTHAYIHTYANEGIRAYVVRVYVCVCVCTKKRVLKLIFVHAYIHTYAKFSMCNTLPSFFQYTCIEKGSMEVVNMQGNWDDRERTLIHQSGC